MRKFDTASNADGSVRKESCNQEDVTPSYAIELAGGQIMRTLEVTLHRGFPGTDAELAANGPR
jgi:hypothetical protein